MRFVHGNSPVVDPWDYGHAKTVRGFYDNRRMVVNPQRRGVHTTITDSMEETTAMSEQIRKTELDHKVRAAVSRGWHVESQSEYQAVLVKGKRPNHILHLLLSIFTLGLWIPVWVFLAVVKHERHEVISV